MRIWVLVSDASRARILHYDAGARKWDLAKELEHPGSRLKGSELLSDAPGRQRQSFGHGRPAMEMPTDPQEVEKERFIRQVADELKHEHDQRAFDALIVVAGPHTLGQLRGVLSAVVKKAVLHEVDKDFAQLDMPVLVARLQSLMDELKVGQQPAE